MNGPLSLRAAAVTSGDPRRPDQVVHYQPPQASDKPSPNLLLIAATVCGVLAMMLKFKELTLLGVVFICSALANAGSDFDWGQLMSTGMLTFMGLFMSYIAPLIQIYHYNKGVAKAAAAAGMPQTGQPGIVPP